MWQLRLHCNLHVRLPDAILVIIRFNYDIHAEVKVEQPISSCLTAFLLLMCCVML